MQTAGRLVSHVLQRRRTQIRLAQRAYRERKEGTLEELRKRVSDLSNTIELMNKAFQDCCGRLVAAGLSEAQLFDIRETTTRYTNLMRNARDAPSTGDEPRYELTGAVHRESGTWIDDQTEPAKLLQPKNVSSWMDVSALSAPPKRRGPMEVGMGYTMYAQANAQDINTLSNSTQASPPWNPGEHSLVNSLDVYGLESPRPTSMPASLTLPTTYSFQEFTFSRRLHRTCLEQAYRLLVNAHKWPATYNRVFKLALTIMDHDTFTANVKKTLSRGPHEPLDLDDILVHIGGAGTHYPSRDQFGQLRPKKQSYNLGIVDPQTLALVDKTVHDNLMADLTVEVPGYEGEWFDANDVEGYLNEKGIFIDPWAAFATVELFSRDAPSGSTMSRGNTDLSWSSTAGVGDQNLAESEHRGQTRAGHSDWDDLFVERTSTIGGDGTGSSNWTDFLQPEGVGFEVVGNEATDKQAGHAARSPNSDLRMSDLYREPFLSDPMDLDRRIDSGIGQSPSQSFGSDVQGQLYKKEVVTLDVTKFIEGESRLSQD